MKIPGGTEGAERLFFEKKAGPPPRAAAILKSLFFCRPTMGRGGLAKPASPSRSQPFQRKSDGKRGRKRWGKMGKFVDSLGENGLGRAPGPKKGTFDQLKAVSGLHGPVKLGSQLAPWACPADPTGGGVRASQGQAALISSQPTRPWGR